MINSQFLHLFIQYQTSPDTDLSNPSHIEKMFMDYMNDDMNEEYIEES